MFISFQPSHSSRSRFKVLVCLLLSVSLLLTGCSVSISEEDVKDALRAYAARRVEEFKEELKDSITAKFEEIKSNIKESASSTIGGIEQQVAGIFNPAAKPDTSSETHNFFSFLDFSWLTDKKYTVIYNPMLGELEECTQKYNDGDKINLPTPSLEGYHFVNWSFEPEKLNPLLTQNGQRKFEWDSFSAYRNDEDNTLTLYAYYSAEYAQHDYHLVQVNSSLSSSKYTYYPLYTLQCSSCGSELSFLSEEQFGVWCETTDGEFCDFEQYIGSKMPYLLELIDEITKYSASIELKDYSASGIYDNMYIDLLHVLHSLSLEETALYAPLANEVFSEAISIIQYFRVYLCDLNNIFGFTSTGDLIKQHADDVGTMVSNNMYGQIIDATFGDCLKSLEISGQDCMTLILSAKKDYETLNTMKQHIYIGTTLEWRNSGLVWVREPILYADINGLDIALITSKRIAEIAAGEVLPEEILDIIQICDTAKSLATQDMGGFAANPQLLLKLEKTFVSYSYNNGLKPILYKYASTLSSYEFYSSFLLNISENVYSALAQNSEYAQNDNYIIFGGVNPNTGNTISPTGLNYELIGKLPDGLTTVEGENRQWESTQAPPALAVLKKCNSNSFIQTERLYFIYPYLFFRLDYEFPYLTGREITDY